MKLSPFSLQRLVSQKPEQLLSVKCTVRALPGSPGLHLITSVHPSPETLWRPTLGLLEHLACTQTAPSWESVCLGCQSHPHPSPQPMTDCSRRMTVQPLGLSSRQTEVLHSRVPCRIRLAETSPETTPLPVSPPCLPGRPLLFSLGDPC